jgi:mono/diheme cytochrome c family protein
VAVHTALLFVHSWLRWLVLAAAVAVVVRGILGARRGSAWTPVDERVHKAAVGLFDLQFLIGLVLYLFLSPLPRAFLAAGAGRMKDATLRFFTIEHAFGMILALALIHVGRARSRKATEAAQKHGRAWKLTAGALFVALASTPWPGLKHGRPLARTGADAQPARDPAGSCPPVYAQRCAACHGQTGRGDGPSAASLSPRPRDFADRSWSGRKDDEQLRRVIRDGGPAVGLAPAMPPHPDLSAADVDALVGCVRSFE